MKMWPMMFVALAACGSQPAENTAAANVSANDAVAAAAPKAATCDLPALDFGAAELDAAAQAAFTAQFRTAFDRACGDGLLAGGPLVDPKAVDPKTLFVLNAPEANVVSIYLSRSAAPGRMLIEAPFGSPPKMPSADDLHEAIYCAVRGATPEEEEESGRCLPD